MSEVKAIDDKWLDEFIEKANLSQTNPIQVNTTKGIEYVKIGSEFLRFIMINRFRILKVGQDIFKQFLALTAKGEDYDALLLVYSSMDTQSLLIKYKENAIKLAEIAQDAQEDRQFWVEFLKFAGGKLVGLALSSLL